MARRGGGPPTGRPLAPRTKHHLLSGLAVFFRQTAHWGWTDVPGRPLLLASDLPRLPLRVPRSIPEDQLARLMAAIRALPCPYRRAALLVARWSGARRDEIRRLAVECLDAYPDGTPRLHLPVGKGRADRLVPTAEEAAAAIRALQQSRRAGDRGLRDDYTGEVTRYLFVHHGQLFLGQLPLRERAGGGVPRGRAGGRGRQADRHRSSLPPHRRDAIG